MIGDKSSFTSLESYDGGVVTFGDGSLAWVKSKGSIVIPGLKSTNLAYGANNVGLIKVN